MPIVTGVVLFIRAMLASRVTIAAENLALRHQLGVLQRSVKRPQLRQRDRLFWVLLSRFWLGWCDGLAIVKPETVIRWHREGFKLYWRWKSRGKPGRPKIDAEIRSLIRRMCRENVTWGAPRIESELALLGYTVDQSTVAKYMIRHRKPPSQTWRTFLENHVPDIAAIDFFVAPTVRFQLLYGFVVLRHDRRRVAHFNVTAHPTARWTAQQIVEAFPYDEAPRFLIRDRDAIYGVDFQLRVEHMGIEEVVIAYRSPSRRSAACIIDTRGLPETTSCFDASSTRSVCASLAPSHFATVKMPCSAGCRGEFERLPSPPMPPCHIADSRDRRGWNIPYGHRSHPLPAIPRRTAPPLLPPRGLTRFNFSPSNASHCTEHRYHADPDAAGDCRRALCISQPSTPRR